MERKSWTDVVRLLMATALAIIVMGFMGVGCIAPASDSDDNTVDTTGDIDGDSEATAEAASELVTHGTMTVTNGTLIVNQALVKQTPSYVAANGSGWWFCGQAAMASAINLIRGNANSGKVTQLEWFHQQLLATPIAGYPYTAANHYQANIDALRKVTDSHPEFVVPAKVYTSKRTTARDGIMQSLDNGYLVVALAQITIGGVAYGHYKTVYKIEHDAAANTGGWVYYADPYTGLPKKEAFSTFLDGMGAAGAAGNANGTPHWSYLKIKKQ